MRALLAFARRDFAGLFRSPVAIVVGVSFLIMQGVSFSAVVGSLSDPNATVGYGAVLRTQFGGTMLFWAIVFGVVSMTTMHVVAGEKQSGQWELTVTTPASLTSILFGKWLAAWMFFCALFLPTTAYPLVLTWFAPEGSLLDIGPVVSAYAGILGVGALLTAVGVAASAATTNQVVSAVSCFCVLIGFLFAGELWDTGSASAFSLRQSLEDCADGLLRIDSVLAFSLLAGSILIVTSASCRLGRVPAKMVLSQLVPGVLLFVIGVQVGIVGQYDKLRVDLTSSRLHSLGVDTKTVLHRVASPLEVLVVEPGRDDFRQVFRLVGHVVEQMAEEQRLVQTTHLDPALAPEGVDSLAHEFALSPVDLAEGGAVAFRYQGRSTVVDVLDLAAFSTDALGRGAMAQFRAEEAFARAITSLTEPTSPTICHSWRGTGLSPEDFRDFLPRLERGGYRLHAKDSLADLATCDAIMLLGVNGGLSPEELSALDKFVVDGGGLFVSLTSNPEASEPTPDTGVAAVLERYGVTTPPFIVVDPEQEVGLPLAWMTSTGYGSHPITDGFQGRRVSIWSAPRLVVGGVPLVSASSRGWAESDVSGLAAGEDIEPSGAELVLTRSVACAAEKGQGRVVVLGSTRSLSSILTDKGLTGASALAANSFAWLVGRGQSSLGEGRVPERLRLVMTDGERRAVFVFSAVVLPLLFGLFAFSLLWRTRS